jgi:hypothetical protein
VSEDRATLRLLLADQGAFREVDLQVPREALDRYERLIDLLQEEPAILRASYVDLRRLCTARVLEEGET